MGQTRFGFSESRQHETVFAHARRASLTNVMPPNLSEEDWRFELPADLRKKLNSIGQRRVLNKRETLYWIDDAPDGLWHVESGCVSCSIAPCESGPMVVGNFHRNQWFGAEELFDASGRTCTIRATRDSILTCYPLCKIEKIARERPELWRAIGRLVSSQINAYQVAVGDLIVRDNCARLAGALLRLAGDPQINRPHKKCVEVDITQEELARLSNLSRSVTAKILSEFKKQNIVRIRYGSVVLSDVPRLQVLRSAE